VHPEILAKQKLPEEQVTKRVWKERYEDIATTHGLSRHALSRLNGVDHETEVAAGDVLLVPRVSDEDKARNRDKAARELYASGHPASRDGEPLLVPVPDRNLSVRGRTRVFYRVVGGDSLARVATAFGVDAGELADWNGIDRDGLLFPRMVLQVFVPRDFDAGERKIELLDEARILVVDRGSAEHLAEAEKRVGRERLVITAKGGETLAQVARRYGLEDHDLARINRLPRTTVLTQGQELVVYKVVDPARSKRAAEQQDELDETRRKNRPPRKPDKSDKPDRKRDKERPPQRQARSTPSR